MSKSAERQRLAIEGGVPVRAAPLPSWPYYASDEIEAVDRVLRSGKVNYWTGEECRRFEREYADATGTKYAVALMNGTVALEAAVRGLGIGSGDEVVVPSRTFIASASAVAMCGATPVMADVDPHSQNITAETIATVLTDRTRAVVVVHLAGWPCEMDPILELARQHKLYVIEDCAQAHGATYKGSPVGSFGHAAAFSFCQDKIITTGGEGGMLTTNSHELWGKAWSFKDHGKEWAKAIKKDPDSGFHWLHDSIGTNWRMTEMQAVIGLAQLRKLAGWVESRRRNAAILIAALRDVSALRLTEPPAYLSHAYYRCYAFVRPKLLQRGWSRDRIVAAIRAEGIPCYSGTCGEIYLEKAFAQSESRPIQRLRSAQELAETSVAFLTHPTLAPRDMENAAEAIRKVMTVAMTG